MTPRRSPIGRALGAALVLAAVVPAGASAQVTRTYVAQTGASDVNDCTRASPCATFQRAHDQTVPNGEINALEAGNYSSVVVNRPITIDGSGTVATITPFGAGVTVNLPDGEGRVVLRDIRINAAANFGTHGIDVLRGGTVVTDNVRISGGSQAGIRVQNSQDVFSRLIVDDTKIQGATGSGIVLQPTLGRTIRATIRHTSIDESAGPALHVRPSTGSVARATVRRSHVDANANGLAADSSLGGTATINVFSTGITDSGVGVVGGPGNGILSTGAGSTVRIARNEIQHNQRGLQVLNGGAILSAGDNHIVGNVVNGAPTGLFGPQ
jgi:hypothetical protein